MSETKIHPDIEPQATVAGMKVVKGEPGRGVASGKILNIYANKHMLELTVDNIEFEDEYDYYLRLMRYSRRRVGGKYLDTVKRFGYYAEHERRPLQKGWHVCNVAHKSVLCKRPFLTTTPAPFLKQEINANCIGEAICINAADIARHYSEVVDEGGYYIVYVRGQNLYKDFKLNKVYLDNFSKKVKYAIGLFKYDKQHRNPDGSLCKPHLLDIAKFDLIQEFIVYEPPFRVKCNIKIQLK